ncbi:MAG: hypothetical protein ACYC7J_16105 [Syntrophales bacterium]
MEILLKEIQEKLDLVLQGQDVLLKQIRDTRMELGEKLQSLGFKIDALGN